MSLLKTLLAPTKLKVNLIGLQSSGPMGTSLNSSASTLCLAHLALATLASLFLEKARQIPASDFTLVPPDTDLHNLLPRLLCLCSIVAWVRPSMTTLFTIAAPVPRYIQPPSCLISLHSAYGDYIVHFAYGAPAPLVSKLNEGRILYSLLHPQCLEVGLAHSKCLVFVE